MQYFCSGRCPRVQRILGNFLRIFGAIKIRVALEHKFLKWVSEKKMNIFLLWKIFIWFFWGFIGGIKWIGHLGESQGYAQVTSPFEMIQNPNQVRAKTTIKTKSGKEREGKSRKKRGGKIHAVTVVGKRSERGSYCGKNSPARAPAHRSGPGPITPRTYMWPRPRG